MYDDQERPPSRCDVMHLNIIVFDHFVILTICTRLHTNGMSQSLNGIYRHQLALCTFISNRHNKKGRPTNRLLFDVQTKRPCLVGIKALCIWGMKQARGHSSF